MPFDSPRCGYALVKDFALAVGWDVKTRHAEREEHNVGGKDRGASHEHSHHDPDVDHRTCHRDGLANASFALRLLNRDLAT